jgi:glutamyl/glutaminyl-tRNA synthetase
MMGSPEQPVLPAPAPNPYAAADVAAILQQHGWTATQISSEQSAWCERAATLLGPHALDHEALANLVALVFHYDAGEILASVESHAVVSRTAAREVLRQAALLLLDGAPLTSERLKEIVTVLKEKFDFSSREIFQPLRLALAGRAGEGPLDRVILLLEEAAALPFAAPVKSARARILEFCAALD